jgi:hypothetical protein
MSKITYLIPSSDIKEVSDGIREKLIAQGHKNADLPKVIITTFFANAKRMAERGYDFWLGFGGYLPAVERVIAKINKESADEFYARTQYPKSVVKAYSVARDDVATLVAADLYMQAHRKNTIIGNTVWPLNEEEGQYIDLADFENRITGVSSL